MQDRYISQPNRERMIEDTQHDLKKLSKKTFDAGAHLGGNLE
jgi:hypothetical protein